MATRMDLEIDYAEMGRILRAEGEYSGVRAELTRRMQPVLAAAKASAPSVTGAHKASIHLVQATTDRAVVRVVADSDHSLAVEAKTGNLARALAAAGGA